MDLTRDYSTDLFWYLEVETWNVPLIDGAEIAERPARQTTITRRYTERALDFIDKHRDGPFFL
jgi:hypothetical protein